MDRDLVRISKFLSLVLRHEPGHAGLTLDPNGWVGVLRVRAGAMHGDGHLFVLSANGVWLIETVPSAYLGFP